MNTPDIYADEVGWTPMFFENVDIVVDSTVGWLYAKVCVCNRDEEGKDVYS